MTNLREKKIFLRFICKSRSKSKKMWSFITFKWGSILKIGEWNALIVFKSDLFSFHLEKFLLHLNLWISFTSPDQFKSDKVWTLWISYLHEKFAKTWRKQPPRISPLTLSLWLASDLNHDNSLFSFSITFL